MCRHCQCIIQQKIKMYQLLHWCKMRCPYTTHFAPMLQLAIVKNQNLAIVTLVQNALLLIQRILHQYNNLYILIFLLQNALEMSTHFASKQKLMQNALIWYIHQNVPIVTLVQNALSLYNAFCTNETIGKIVKNQNLPIVTLVQNALLQIQRILHQ